MKYKACHIVTTPIMSQGSVSLWHYWHLYVVQMLLWFLTLIKYSVNALFNSPYLGTVAGSVFFCLGCCRKAPCVVMAWRALKHYVSYLATCHMHKVYALMQPTQSFVLFLIWEFTFIEEVNSAAVHFFPWEGKYEIRESNAAAVFHQILYMS